MTLGKSLVFIILITTFCINISSSQEATEILDTRKTEADIKIEDRFVAAKFLVAAGKKQDAIKLLDTIRRESGGDAAVYFELAKLHYDLKDINQTETNLKSAVKLAPDNIWLRSFEAGFFRDLGRFDDAITTLKHISTLSPKNGDIYDQIVGLYIRKKDFPSALKTLDNKELNIGFAENTILKKAEILDNQGKPLEAVTEINKLVSRYPSRIKYLKLIVNLLQSNDKAAEAMPYYQKILALDPDDTDAKLATILSTNKTITQEDYLVTLTPLIENKDVPIDLKIKELIKFVEKHATNQDTVLGKNLIALCDKLVIVHPNEAKAHAIFADVLMNNGETTASIRQYEKTLTLNKKNFMVWEQLMFGLASIENYDELLKVSTEAIDYFPNQAISYYFAGKALVYKNEIKKAESNLDEATLISAGNPNITSRILTVKAEIKLKNKEYAKAMELIDQALTTSQGKNADAMEVKGDIYKSQNDQKNAMISWQKSKDLGNKTSRLASKLMVINGNG